MKSRAPARWPGRHALNHARSGSVALEFAVLVLPFLTLVFGVIEYARFQWTRGALQEVAIASARCAGLQAVACTAPPGPAGGARTFSDSRTRTFITTQAANWYLMLPPASITLTNSAATTCEGAANFVKVALTYSFSSPFLVPLSQATYPVSAVACFPNQS